MLEVKDICKEYRTGTLVQKALDHVSLALRDNEFVAILGPSGSGKTTLLNIIGGLDRYDSGDLIINGISTKKYKDRDWDSYRNHTIGFVFQSYNLIPHQTVLSNVELALTISGISRAERRKRAEEALQKVGLGEQMHKKPNQMSGGQMQRVAIARALVNDPDILLADEPTGALDSDTSVQVMDLLREVASDRLVVMVTHNPELAEQYATRIVRLKDGRITSDTDPFVPVPSGEPVHRNMGRSSMSFLTALALSFNNLRSKLARTVLVAFAGSIGITGIALILSLSNGVDKYIQNVEEETLSEYPILIQNSSFDLASMIVDERDPDAEKADVVERKTLSSMFSRISSNDLESLRAYFESGKSGVEKHARAIEYSYSLTPNIYIFDGYDYRQVNPDQTFSSLGVSFSGVSSMYTSYSSSNVFQALPRTEALYRNQYDIRAGRWPSKINELVLVLSGSGRVTDMTLYAMGLKDYSELDDMIKRFSSGETVEDTSGISSYKYEDFLNLKFYVVNGFDYYVYDSEYNVWTDKRSDKVFMRNLLNASEELTIVGVVQPKEDSNVAMLNYGINYMPELVDHLIGNAEESGLVRSQIDNPDTDVLSNTPFGEESRNEFDTSSMFEIDENAMANAFKFDASALNMGFSNININTDNIDMSSLSDGFSMPDMDFASLLGKIKIDITSGEMQELFTTLLNGWMEYSSSNPATDYSKLPEAIRKYFEEDEEIREVILEDIRSMISGIAQRVITEEQLEPQIQELLVSYNIFKEAYINEHTTEVIVVDEDGNEHTVREPEIEEAEIITAYLQTPEAQALVGQLAQNLIAALEHVELTAEDIEPIVNDLISGYTKYAQENNLPDITKIGESFSGYLSTEEARSVITKAAADAIDTSELEAAAADMMSSFGTQIADAIKSVMDQVVSSITTGITEAMSSMSKSLETAFAFDPNAFANAIHVKMTAEDMQELMTSMMSEENATYDSNLAKFGYADRRKPYSITIYPVNFDAKASIKQILDDYNDRMRIEDEDKVITYTDIVGTLMTSVTDIINAISYVLIAFVAISLVVSSIMIGVITYISVLERKKEIGILRAIGASKHNISEVFNAETFIIGILAGVFGILTTELLLIPGNMIIHRMTDIDSINAALPPGAAAVLIILSVILTLIGGIIPSRKAAKSDPVTALRTE